MTTLAVTPAPAPAHPAPVWAAHDHPDRPFDTGTRFCRCRGCREAIRREALARPRTPVTVHTRSDRLVVTVEYLAATLRRHLDLAPLLYVDGDRYVSLSVPGDWWFDQRERWWSKRCHDDERRTGRRHLRHRVAARQPRSLRSP